MSIAEGSQGREVRLRRNLLVVLWTMVLHASSAMMVPVLNTIWAECQLSYSQVTVLQGFFAFILAGGEIPGGIVADVFGYRRALIISHLLAFAAALLYCFADSFAEFLLAEAFFGLSFCLVSGCREALIYDSLKELEQEGRYDYVWARIKTVILVVMAVSSAVAGPLAAWLGYRSVLVLLAIFFGLSVPLQWMVVEPVRIRARFSPVQFVAILRFCLFERRFLAWWLLFAAFLTTANQAGLWLQQPYFLQECKLPLVSIGLIFAVGHLLAAFGSWIAPRVNQVALAWRIVMAVVLVAAGYLLMGSLVTVWSIGFFYLLQLARGFNGVLFSTEINKIAHPSARATTHSIGNMLAALSYGAISMETGNYAANSSISSLYLLVGVTTLLGGLVFIFARRGCSKRNEQSQSALAVP